MMHTKTVKTQNMYFGKLVDRWMDRLMDDSIDGRIEGCIQRLINKQRYIEKNPLING